jgi:hypothetical protein
MEGNYNAKRYFDNPSPPLIQPFTIEYDLLREFHPKVYFVTLPYYGGAAANSSITVESDVIVETNDETGVINHTIIHQPNLPPIGKKHQSSLTFRFDKLELRHPSCRITPVEAAPSTRGKLGFCRLRRTADGAGTAIAARTISLCA